MSVARGGTALIGVFAILLQAALFGWHNHPLPLFSRGLPTLQAAAAAPGHDVPVAADNDCQICFALAHHSGAPVHFIAAPLPTHATLHATAFWELVTLAAPYYLFRSRAPPRA